MFERFEVVLEALSPISHGDVLTGTDNATNMRLFARQGVQVDGVPIRIPHLSENALRSRIWRYPLADHLVDTLQIGDGELPQGIRNLLYSGGNLKAGSRGGGDENVLGHQVRKLYPSLELLGGAVDTFVLPEGRLKPAAWPVTREYARPISFRAPHLVEEAEGVSIHDLLFEEVRTRGTGGESDGNQMLYSYETLAAGTRVLMSVTLTSHTSPEGRAACALALGRWEGFFGGQGRQGRGAMEIESLPDIDTMPYEDHIRERGEEMKAGLLDGTLGTGRVLCE